MSKYTSSNSGGGYCASDMTEVSSDMTEASSDMTKVSSEKTKKVGGNNINNESNIPTLSYSEYNLHTDTRPKSTLSAISSSSSSDSSSKRHKQMEISEERKYLIETTKESSARVMKNEDRLNTDKESVMLKQRGQSAWDNYEGFIDAVLYSPHPISVIDLSYVDFDNIDKCETFNEIRGSYYEDRMYRFVMSKESPMFQLNCADKESYFEWDSVDNAVEVYKLPANLRWPTMHWPKQSANINCYTFPEFIIRRMNVMHRHRVNATMNRLWFRPHAHGDKTSRPSGERIVWIGATSGCGKSIAVSEIVLECILKLKELGKADNQTKWEFYVRNNTTLSKFFYDAHSQKVSHVSYEHGIKENLLSHLKAAYEANKHSFVIYALNENEKYSTIWMPFLLSPPNSDLENNLKEIFKTDSHSTYLYDAMLGFEFKFFLNVCFAFGDSSRMIQKDEYLRRFHIQGGVLRKIFSRYFIDPFQYVHKFYADFLVTLGRCSPLNVVLSVDSLVTVRFDYAFSYKDDRYYIQYRDIYLRRRNQLFPSENIPLEYFHSRHRWRLEILSDHINLAIGTHVMLLKDEKRASSFALRQVQELISIYGGILKEPAEGYKLPERFMMVRWEFYECTIGKYWYENQKRNHEYDVTGTYLCYDQHLDAKKRLQLIAKMPSTSRICYFYGRYLQCPFQELSSGSVYHCRASKWNGSVVCDAMTANPASKQIFFFKSTLLDPRLQTIDVTSFNKTLSNLHIYDGDDDDDADEVSLINEIYFYIITSENVPIESHHFFTFEIAEFFFDSCYLKAYTSEVGLRAINRIISVDPNCTSYSRSILSKDEVKLITLDELVVLLTIIGFSNKTKINYYKLTLSGALHKDLLSFLRVASKIKPYICRAPFMSSDLY